MKDLCKEAERLNEKVKLLTEVTILARMRSPKNPMTSVEMHTWLRDNDYYDNDDEMAKSLHHAEQIDAKMRDKVEKYNKGLRDGG